MEKGTLILQDLKMADQKRTKTGKYMTWNMTDQIADWKMQELENDGPGYSKVLGVCVRMQKNKWLLFAPRTRIFSE